MRIECKLLFPSSYKYVYKLCPFYAQFNLCLVIQQPAIKYSKMLCSDKKMKSQLDKSSFKRKIQLIIRRSQTHEVDNEAQVSPYEYLSNDVVTFPICICSGMFLDCNLDWTFCPQSGMPALLSKYVDYADKYGEDPIKGQLISSIDAKKVRYKTMCSYQIILMMLQKCFTSSNILYPIHY
jgi:hypothetical protein